ncbi:hypothetical protein A7A76_07840 [Lysobacter enzymogenes]|uniref:tail fiber domain-containing protein n=1 Tax=Lysobacter enzymogenes TaxID=69 RepID=UPI0019CFE03A|nr:tail fiber domain-containing protein [Lysobacter enzymogenes]MBN7139005.1 hypothetical protein [Lysobacter enzymogenes]
MAKQLIVLGTPPGGADGDTIRAAFDKVNQNFSENYATLGNLVDESGKVTAKSGLAVTGAATVSNGLSVTGTTSSTGDSTVGGRSKVAGNHFNGTTLGMPCVLSAPGTSIALRPNGADSTSKQAVVRADGVVTFGYHIVPVVDNSGYCGVPAGGRWEVVCAVTGTINTSDAREKTAVHPLTPAECAAAQQLAGEIGTYQWLQAVQAKGYDARVHVGQTVQRIMQVMQQHGLDPFRYGFVCYDSWGDEPAVVDAEGLEIQPAREAGDRYSLRPDEFSMFLCRGLASRLADVEGRLANLEAGA